MENASNSMKCFHKFLLTEVAHPFIYICIICLPHRRDCVTRSFVVPSFWVVEKSLWDVYQHWCNMARTKNWISDKLLWKCVLKNMLYLYDYNNKHDTPESVIIHRGRCKTMLSLQIVFELGLQDLYINTLLFWQESGFQLSFVQPNPIQLLTN